MTDTYNTCTAIPDQFSNPVIQDEDCVNLGSRKPAGITGSRREYGIYHYKANNVGYVFSKKDKCRPCTYLPCVLLL